MRRVTKPLAAAFLALVAFVAAATYWSKNRLFPYAEAEILYHGYADEHSFHPNSRIERIENDIGVFPYRHTIVLANAAIVEGDYRPLGIPDLLPDRDPPRVFIDRARRKPGLTLVSGVLETAQGLHAALLLDPDGRVLHRWRISDEDIGFPDYRVRPDGIEPLPDGSLIVAMTNGDSLTRYDACGGVIWRRRGNHHHSVALDGAGHAWTWLDEHIVRVRVEDGKADRLITLAEVIAANPDIDPLGIRQEDYWAKSQWTNDALHGNDIEPLPPALAPAFPGFEAGDLLVSLRSINLVFVLDPDDLRIKWWRQGAGRRQHDPDWNPDGTITFFDNNMHRGVSRIRRIDPATFALGTVVSGEPHGLYTQIMGRHQIRADGSVMIVSSYQGRAFEVAPDGRVVFDYVNTFRASDNRVGVLGDVHVLPPDFYEEMPTCDHSS